MGASGHSSFGRTWNCRQAATLFEWGWLGTGLGHDLGRLKTGPRLFDEKEGTQKVRMVLWRQRDVTRSFWLAFETHYSKNTPAKSLNIFIDTKFKLKQNVISYFCKRSISSNQDVKEIIHFLTHDATFDSSYICSIADILTWLDKVPCSSVLLLLS